MRAPKKVIAAMAMATMIGTGVGQVFADVDPDSVPDFTPNTGNVMEGEQPLQTAIKNVAEQEGVQGDIKINGEFIKKINNFPEVTEEGEYLRVTMPITLNYKYNLDNHLLVSDKGEINNQSIKATKDSGTGKISTEDKSVKMSFVNVETDNEKVAYVDTIKTDGSMDNKVQLPFELVMTRNGDKFDHIPLVSMENGGIINKEYIVQPGSTLELSIGKINSQKVTGSFDSEDKVSVGSKMTLRFEYVK